MAERWQTSEGRTAAVFFRDTTGAPVTGLTPTATSAFKDGTAGAPAATVTEVGNGFYRIGFASAPTKDVLVRVDGGGTLTTTRYIALEVPVGGYVDSIDTATSTRASQASVTALGSPAQAADYTSARAAKLDQLDASVSSRATAAAVTALGSPAQASDWTSARAAKVDNLDAPISSRATSAAVSALSSAITAVQADTDALQVDTLSLLARLTAARALLIDQLDPAATDPIARESDIPASSGTVVVTPDVRSI